MQKKSFSPLPPPPQTYGNKSSHLESMIGAFPLAASISLPKRVCHHFWPGLISLAKNTLPIIDPTYYYYPLLKVD
jgi:hypothetical protein